MRLKLQNMRPKDFKQSTKVLQRPSTMPKSSCQSLPVWCDGEQCVSCWRASFMERVRILLTGNVWLGVLSGKSQPPVYVSGESVFYEEPISGRISGFFGELKESIAEVWKNVREASKQPDKRKHFIVGFILSLIVGALSFTYIGFATGCVAGAFKEWWDSKGHGAVELMDFFFTGSGALCAMPFAYGLHCLIF